MKILVLLFSCLAVISADHLIDGALSRGENVAAELRKAKFIKGVYSTPMDHFSTTNHSRLSLKYEVNVEFFKAGGPIFLCTEFDLVNQIESYKSGLMHSLARKLNGALIESFSRYMNLNEFKDKNFQQELKYLTFDHILGDIPYLVDAVKERLNSTSSRVVAFGYHIGGTIAVLARKQFPHVIDAAWSSGGLFQPIMYEPSFYEELAHQIYEYGGADCSSALSRAFKEIKQLIDDENVVKFRELFKIPKHFQLDLGHPQSAGFIFRLFLYKVITTTTHWKRNTVQEIQELCSNATYSENAAESFARYYDFYTIRNNFILNFDYGDFVKGQSTTWPQEYFLFCTRFASRRYITPKNGFQNIFPHVLTEQFNDQLCTDLFGSRYNKTLLEQANRHFNLRHGGGTQYVSNVVFSEGNMDLHRFKGVTKYDPNTSVYVSIESHGMVSDMQAISDADSENLKAAKQRIIEKISEYIGFGEGTGTLKQASKREELGYFRAFEAK